MSTCQVNVARSSRQKTDRDRDRLELPPPPSSVGLFISHYWPPSKEQEVAKRQVVLEELWCESFAQLSWHFLIPYYWCLNGDWRVFLWSVFHNAPVHF